MFTGEAVDSGHSGDGIAIRAQFLDDWQAQARACGTSGFIPLPDPVRAADAPAAPRRWRQLDVKRAINAAEQAGLRHYRVEITPDGTIAVVVGADSPAGSEVVARRA